MGHENRSPDWRQKTDFPPRGTIISKGMSMKRCLPKRFHLMGTGKPNTTICSRALDHMFSSKPAEQPQLVFNTSLPFRLRRRKHAGALPRIEAGQSTISLLTSDCRVLPRWAATEDSIRISLLTLSNNLLSWVRENNTRKFGGEYRIIRSTSKTMAVSP